MRHPASSAWTEARKVAIGYIVLKNEIIALSTNLLFGHKIILHTVDRVVGVSVCSCTSAVLPIFSLSVRRIRLVNDS